MGDPKRPIAELVKRWNREIERLEALSPNITDPITNLLCGGLLELQAAIDEQIRAWDETAQQLDETEDFVEAELIRSCISDLRGDNQGGEE